MFYDGKAYACCTFPELQVHRAPRGSGLANTGHPAQLRSVLIHTVPVKPKASHACRTHETGVKCTRRVMTVILWLSSPYIPASKLGYFGVIGLAWGN